jgi:hypothetical protein
MGVWLQGLGLMPEAIAMRFLFINSEAPEYRAAGTQWKSE